MAEPNEKLSGLAQRLRGAGVTKITHDADGVVTFHAETPAARAGHNRGPSDEINPATAGQLKAIIERIERLEEEKRTISDDIKEVYGEGKANGFDTKIVRKIVRLRGQDPAERREEAELLETYLRALGME